MSYTWDGNKNKTSESISGVMSGYGFPSAGTTYDHEDRLTGFARASGSFTQSWNLTSVGDWNSVTPNGTAQTRTHGPTHELLTAGGQNVSTDLKGNITYLPLPLGEGQGEGGTGPHPVSLLWDFENKLKSADADNNGTADVNFHYDALGRRVARVGSSGSLVYVQLDQQTIADYGYGDNPSSPTYRYVYASYIDEPVIRKGAGTGGTIHYYHRNQQYSVNAVTTSTGAVAERYAYTAYGQPTFLDSSGSPLTPQSSTLGNRHTYTGREWDATLGLYHFRARWMSGLTGRFLTRDTMGYVDGSNLYGNYFVVDATDPSGRERKPAKRCPWNTSEEWELVQGPDIGTGFQALSNGKETIEYIGNTYGTYNAVRKRSWAQARRHWEVVNGQVRGCGEKLNYSLSVTLYNPSSWNFGGGIQIGHPWINGFGYGEYTPSSKSGNKPGIQVQDSVSFQACHYQYEAWGLLEKITGGVASIEEERVYVDGKYEWQYRSSDFVAGKGLYTGGIYIAVCRKRCRECSASCPKHEGEIDIEDAPSNPN